MPVHRIAAIPGKFKQKKQIPESGTVKVVKTDLLGNPIRPRPICAKCGKPAADHRAGTRECPVGQKHRTVGYTNYGPGVFEAKPARSAPDIRND